MLAAEQDARLSEAFQAATEAAEASADTDWMDVAEQMQRQVVSEFLPPDASVAERLGALHQLRQHADGRALQVRYNRCGPCRLQPGDAVPPGLKLHDLAANRDDAALPSDCLVLAGSWS